MMRDPLGLALLLVTLLVGLWMLLVGNPSGLLHCRALGRQSPHCIAIK